MAGRLGKPEYILGVNRVGIRWQYVNWYIALFADFIAGQFDQEVTPELIEGVDFVFKRFRTLYTNPSTPSSTEVWAGFAFGPSDIGVLEQYNFVWGFWVDVEGLKTARIPGSDSNTTFFDPGILFFTATPFSDTSAAFDATARLTAATDNGDGTVTAYRRFLGGQQLEDTFVGLGPQVVNTFQAGADPQFSQTFVFYTKPSSTFIWYRVQQENFNIERAALNLNRPFTLRDKETRGNKIRLYGEFSDVDPAEAFMVETEPYDLDVFVQDDFDTTDLTVTNDFGLVSGIYFENAALSGTPPVIIDPPQVNSSGLIDPELIEVDISEFLIGEYQAPIVFATSSGLDNILLDDLPELVSGTTTEIVIVPNTPVELLVQISGAEYLQGEYFRNLLEFSQDSETIFYEDDEFTPLDGSYVEVVNDPSAFVGDDSIEQTEFAFVSGILFATNPIISGRGDDNEIIEVDLSDIVVLDSNYRETVIVVPTSGLADALDIEEVEVARFSGILELTGNYFTTIEEPSGLDAFTELIEVPILPQTLESFYINNQEEFNIETPDEVQISGTDLLFLSGVYETKVEFQEFTEEVFVASGVADPYLQQYFQSVILITGAKGFEEDIAIISGVAILNDSLLEEVVLTPPEAEEDDIRIIPVSGFELVDSFYGLITDEGNPASDGTAETDTIVVSGTESDNFAVMFSGVTMQVVELTEVEESINNVETNLFSGIFTQIILPTDEIMEELEVQTAALSGILNDIVLAADEITEALDITTELISGVSTPIVLPTLIEETIDVETVILSGTQVVDVALIGIDEELDVETTLISGSSFQTILPTTSEDSIEVSTAVISGASNSIILEPEDDNLVNDELEAITELVSGVFTDIILEAIIDDTIEAITTLISGSQTLIVTEGFPTDEAEVITNLISGASFDTVVVLDPIEEELENTTILTSGNITDVRRFAEIAESIEVTTEAISGVITLFDPDPDEIVIETLLGNYLIYSGVIL